MWIYFGRLLEHAAIRAFSLAGTTPLGFLLFTVLAPLIVFAVSVANSWIENGKSKAALQTALGSWMSYVPAIAIAFLLMGCLFCYSFVAVVFDERCIDRVPTQTESSQASSISQPSRTQPTENQISSIRLSKAPAPRNLHQERSRPEMHSSQPRIELSSPASPIVSSAKPLAIGVPTSSVPEQLQLAYPRLEDVQQRFSDTITRRWIDRFSAIRQEQQAEESGFIPGRPYIQPGVSPSEKAAYNKAWSDYGEKKKQQQQASLDRAVQALDQLDRELGVAFLKIEPDLSSSRRAALDCMQLTQAERAEDSDVFSKARRTALESIAIKDLPSSLANAPSQSHYLLMASYLSGLLQKLSRYHCGISVSAR